MKAGGMKDGKARLARRTMLAALLLSLPGPRVQAQEYLRLAPRLRPPPRHETVPPSPGRSYEWAPGQWKWNGTAFFWSRGRYVQSRPLTNRWVKGHAEGHIGNERWIPGFFGGPTRAKPR